MSGRWFDNHQEQSEDLQACSMGDQKSGSTQTAIDLSTGVAVLEHIASTLKALGLPSGHIRSLKIAQSDGAVLMSMKTTSDWLVTFKIPGSSSDAPHG